MTESPGAGAATSLHPGAPGAAAPSPQAGPVPPQAGPVPPHAGAAPAAPRGPAPSPPGPPAPAPGGPVPSRRGRRLLIALAAVAGGLAVAAAAVVAVALFTHRPHHAHVSARPLRATVFRLRPGQCFDSLPNGIAGAHVVPCARPHDGEIYGEFRVAGRAWPGTAALQAQAQRGCQRKLSGYLNPELDTTGLADSYAYPNQGAWAAGERSVVCEIRPARGTLTGSVRAFG